MTLRATIIALVVVALSLAGLGYLYTGALQRETTIRTQLEEATEAHNRALARSNSDRKVLIAREARKASEARKLARENQTLLNALRRNETWGNTNVPPDVQEALHGAAGALPAASDGGSSAGPAGGVRD